MTDLETAEWVGCYFGLQQAANMKLPFPRDDSSSRAQNAIGDMCLAKMHEIEAKLPPGTIDAWPRQIPL